MYNIQYLPFEVYKVYKIYEFFDEPLVYSFVDRNGNLYLANWANWDEETNVNTWLYLPISKANLNKLEKKECTQRDIFEEYRNESVYVVNEDGTEEKFYISKVYALDKDWIPGKNSYIEDINLQEESENNIYELVENTVIESNRYIVNLSLDHGEHEKEIDSKVLGEFLIDYQNLINAVSLDRDATTRSRIPADIEEENKRYVHDLVCESFRAKDKHHECINHINGIKTDNRVENLEWTTYSENNKHAYENNLKCNRGENQSRHKLKEEDVLEIRRLYAKGDYTHRGLAKDFGVTHGTIGNIIRRKIWTHI